MNIELKLWLPLMLIDKKINSSHCFGCDKDAWRDVTCLWIKNILWARVSTMMGGLRLGVNGMINMFFCYRNISNILFLIHILCLDVIHVRLVELHEFIFSKSNMNSINNKMYFKKS